MKTGKLFFEKKIIIAFIIYFLLNAILLLKFGIQTSGEAEKYIDNANRILNGQELRNGFFGIFYFVYSLFVSLFIKFSISLQVVAVFQVLLSFIAAISFYKLLLYTNKDRSIAFLFFVAYLLCYPIQKWNFFLYSESMHTSLLVIGSYIFVKLLREKSYSLVGLFGILLLAILFSRPVGIIFLMTAFLVLINWFYHNNKKILSYLFIALSLVAVIVMLKSPVVSFINPDSLKKMEIICQVPEANQSANYQEFNRAGLSKVYTVIKDEIGFSNFFAMGFKKLGNFFFMYRSYYSWQNNLVLLSFCVFYLFAIVGLFSRTNGELKYVKRFAVIYLLITAVAIFFTCDDWANRFISPAFPFVLLLAALGFVAIKKRYGNKPVVDTAAD